MSESAAFKVRIIDYKLYKTEMLELRRHSWLSSSSNVDSEKLISKKDDAIDIKAIYCGVFENQKLIASHRLQPITNIKDLPFSNHFETSKIVDSNWYTYGTDGTDYVKMAAAKKTKLANSPVVLANSKTSCVWAGSISVVNPGQTKIDCT